MITKTMNPADISQAIELLRANGVPEEMLAEMSAKCDDAAITQGVGPQELNALRAKVSDNTHFLLLNWTVVHGKIEL
jgi:hypothetical protein